MCEGANICILYTFWWNYTWTVNVFVCMCVCVCECRLCVRGPIHAYCIHSGGIIYTHLYLVRHKKAQCNTLTYTYIHTYIQNNSTGAVAAILATAVDAEVRRSVACIIAENPFKSPESVAHMTVSAVVFRVLICKNNALLIALLYPFMKVVQLIAILKVRVFSVVRFVC